MKMLIDIFGDFTSDDEMLDFINTQLNGTSYTTNVLWMEANKRKEIDRYLNCKCGYSRKVLKSEIVINHTCPRCAYEYMEETK